MRGRSRIAMLGSLLLLISCTAGAATDTTGSTRHSATIAFSTRSGPVRTDVVPVASSEAERERGLMGRSTLPPNGGMLFAYPEPTEIGFWMKDTAIPLSVAFWDDDDRVLAILDMDPCHADPCPVYRPAAAYRTALEMRRGWFDQHGVRIGDRVELIEAAA